MQEFTLNEIIKQLDRIEKKINEIAETKIIVNRPEQKGIWSYSADGIICSNCGYKLVTTGLLSYCPHCSANMEEVGILVRTGKIYTNTEENSNDERRID